MELGDHKRLLKACSTVNFWTNYKTTSWTLLLPHHGNQTICAFHLERSQSGSLASSLHLHRRPKWRLNSWTSVLGLETHPRACLPHSLTNETWPILFELVVTPCQTANKKSFFCYKICGFWLYKSYLSLFPLKCSLGCDLTLYLLDLNSLRSQINF